MKSFDSIKARTRALIAEAPISAIFPEEPWDYAALNEIAQIVEDFVNQDTGVIDEYNPWVTWLERWRFHNEVR